MFSLCAIPSSLATGLCCPELTVGIAGGRARRSDAAWLPVLRLIGSAAFAVSILATL